MSISKMLHVITLLVTSLLVATAGWAQAGAETDMVSGASPEAAVIDDSKELPVRTSRPPQKPITLQTTITLSRRREIPMPSRPATDGSVAR